LNTLIAFTPKAAFQEILGSLIGVITISLDKNLSKPQSFFIDLSEKKVVGKQSALVELGSNLFVKLN